MANSLSEREKFLLGSKQDVENFRAQQAEREKKMVGTKEEAEAFRNLPASQREAFAEPGETSDNMPHVNLLQQLMSKAPSEGYKEAIEGIKNVGKGAAHLGKSALQGAVDFPISAANLLQLHKLVGNPNKPFRVPITENPNQLAYLLGAAVSPLDPYAKITAPIKAAKAGASFANKLMRNIAEGGARGALTTAGMGETLPEQADEGAMARNLLMGGALGSAIGGAGGLIGPAIKGAIPAASNLVLERLLGKSKTAPEVVRTPEKVGRMAEHLPENIRFNIGEIVNDPTLKKLYTQYMGKVPFTGVKKQELQAVNEAVKTTNDITKKLLGGHHEEEVAGILRGDIARLKDSMNKKANNLYEKVKSDTKDVKFEHFPAASHLANKYLSENAAMKAKFLTDKDIELLKGWGSAISPSKERFAEAIKGKGKLKFTESELAALTGKAPHRTFDQIRSERSALGDLARKARADKDYRRASVLDEIKGALGKDIERELNKTGNRAAAKEWKEAEKFYATKVAPLKHDSAIMKIINGKTPDSSIANVLVNSQQKKGKDYIYTSPIFDMLPQKDKNLIGYLKMQPALKKEFAQEARQASPLGFKRRIDVIPETIQKRLFTPEMRKEIEKQGILAKATAKGAEAAQIHSTGVQSAEIETLMKWIKNLGIGSALSATGHVGGRLLTSPKLREAYIKGEKIKKGSKLEEELLQDVLGKKAELLKKYAKESLPAREKAKRFAYSALGQLSPYKEEE